MSLSLNHKSNALTISSFLFHISECYLATVTVNPSLNTYILLRGHSNTFSEFFRPPSPCVIFGVIYPIMSCHVLFEWVLKG